MSDPGRARTRDQAASRSISDTMDSPTSQTTERTPSPFDVARIAAQLRSWQERLLDLSKGNPLLGINRSRVSKLRVVSPDLTTLFTDLVLDEKKLKLPFVKRKPKRARAQTVDEEEGSDEFVVEPGDLSFDAKPDDLWRRLRRIFDNARTTVEERGVTTLHLAVGTLEWDDPSLGDSNSPLWLIPCQFEYAGPNAPLRLHLADEEIQLNPALELYLREKQKVTLPPIPEEPTSDSLQAHLAAVQSAVAEQHWTVRPDVWLSTFTFESLVIYQDLKVMAEAAAHNGIVAALSRAGLPPEASEALGEELDELPAGDQIPIPVLPTDSSQLRALALAAGGRNLVVHGPPGTGKSQTIANLIADALGRGKRVLFVSAKMAALDVVHDRLAERGLARFCLEAHSTKAGKAKIIEELKRTLETNPARNSLQLKEQLEELLEVRTQLNEYVRQLHARREPLGTSVFRAIGRAAKLQSTPDLGPFDLPVKDPLQLGRTELRGYLDLLRDLGAQAAVFDVRPTHPWRGFDSEVVGARAEQVEAAVRSVLNHVTALRDNLGSLTPLFGERATFSLKGLSAMAHGLELLAAVDELPRGWSVAPMDDLARGAELLAEAATQARTLGKLQREFESDAAMPAAECVQLLAPLRQQYRPWHRVLQPGYWRFRRSMQARLQEGVPAGFKDLCRYLALAEQIVVSEEWFSSHADGLSVLLSGQTSRVEDRFTLVEKRYRCATSLRAAMDEHGLVGQESAAVSPSCRQSAAVICRALGQAGLTDSVALIQRGWPEGFSEGADAASAPLDAVIARCTEILAAPQRRHEWELCAATVKRCQKAGLGPSLNALGVTSAHIAADAFEHRFYVAWVNQVVDQDPALRMFSAERRAERVERFQQLDERIRRASLESIRDAASASIRGVTGARSNLGDLGEVGVLRRELQKRTRIKPLRKLFSEIPHVLQALKPCMLMSPLSVSTFLKPGAVEFDLVVFDEASQLPTPEAIPAILRAKQVVVAGDENQLPPTSFFEAATIFDDDDEAEEAEDLSPLESLLDDCVAINPVFGTTNLNWHYRSRDERLINFSNHYFYNNALVTFPSATTESDGRGIRLEYILNGIWDRGRSRTNRMEATAVARIVIDQLRRFPDRSIGVAAMNTTQREAIEVAINEMIESRPDLAPLLSASRSEPFFVKSLENVQGDERDTIIISVGYAKTSAGALSLNFGPLNREGGWRRLNVLVTRAKWQTILVTSLQSHELAAVQARNRGAFMLRKFIEYAEQGGALPAESAALTSDETNDFEEAVAAALRDRGLTVDEQVGVGGYRIDLAVRDPRDARRYLLGIECDGATYHGAKTARDRDLLRQQVLRIQGWRLHRLWSTEWFHDREKAIDGVMRSVDVALSSAWADAPEAPIQTSAPVAAGEGEFNHSQEAVPQADRRYPAGEPYSKYRANRAVRSEVIMDSSRTSELASLIASIVRCEGPVHEQVLMDRLKEICGVSRAGSNIHSNVQRAIRTAVTKDGVRYDGGRHMLYGANPIAGFRTVGDGVLRSIDLVATEEIELAIFHVVEDQFGYPREHLPKAVSELMQLGRATASVSETVGNVVDALVDAGRLRISGPNVYLP